MGLDGSRIIPQKFFSMPYSKSRNSSSAEPMHGITTRVGYHFGLKAARMIRYLATLSYERCIIWSW